MAQVGRRIVVSGMAAMLLAAPARFALAQPAVAWTDEVTSTVETVDVQARQVLLRGPDGRLTTFRAGPEVINLAQLKPGDRVTARFRAAVAAQLANAPDGAPDAEETVDAVGAPRGSVPGGGFVEQLRVRVQVDEIDLARNRVIFTGPRGITRSVAVETPPMQAFLRTLKPGDRVDVTFTDALAVSVTPMAG